MWLVYFYKWGVIFMALRPLKESEIKIQPIFKLATSKTKELVIAGINGDDDFPELLSEYKWSGTLDYNMALIIVAFCTYCLKSENNVLKTFVLTVARQGSFLDKLFEELKKGNGNQVKYYFMEAYFDQAMDIVLKCYLPNDENKVKRTIIINNFKNRVAKITPWRKNKEAVVKLIDDFRYNGLSEFQRKNQKELDEQRKQELDGFKRTLAAKEAAAKGVEFAIKRQKKAEAERKQKEQKEKERKQKEQEERYKKWETTPLEGYGKNDEIENQSTNDLKYPTTKEIELEDVSQWEYKEGNSGLFNSESEPKPQSEQQPPSEEIQVSREGSVHVELKNEGEEANKSKLSSAEVGETEGGARVEPNPESETRSQTKKIEEKADAEKKEPEKDSKSEAPSFSEQDVDRYIEAGVKNYGVMRDSNLYDWLTITYGTLFAFVKDATSKATNDLCAKFKDMLMKKYSEDKQKIELLFKNIIEVSFEKKSENPLFGYTHNGTKETIKMEKRVIKFTELIGSELNDLSIVISFNVSDKDSAVEIIKQLFDGPDIVLQLINKKFYDNNEKRFCIDFKSEKGQKKIDDLLKTAAKFETRSFTINKKVDAKILQYKADILEGINELKITLPMLEVMSNLNVEYGQADSFYEEVN